jgi:exosortase
MDLVRQGNTITILSGSGESSMDIAEGCSGIRSLMALTMIAAVFAHYTQKSLWKKAVLFGSSLPLAIIGNFGRIFTILVIAQMGFADFAMKTFHDWAGLLFFFPIALSGLYLIDYLLNIRERRKRKKKVSVSRKNTPQIAK